MTTTAKGKIALAALSAIVASTAAADWRRALPRPVYDERPELVDFYYKAWVAAAAAAPLLNLPPTLLKFPLDWVLGKIEGRRRGQQRMRWLDGITDSTDMSLGRTTPIFWSALDKNPIPEHLFEGNPVGERTTRRGTDTPVPG